MMTPSPSHHSHLQVQKWFESNDLIAADYTASEGIVDALELNVSLQTANFQANAVVTKSDYRYQEYDEYVAKE